jgi:putative aldouronate transport system permease protein
MVGRGVAASRTGTRVGSFLIILVLSFFALTAIVPMLHELALSLSSNESVLAMKVGLIPVDPSLKSFRAVFEDAGIYRALVFSLALTFLYTAMSMLFTIACAYPLTRPELKGRKLATTIVVVTMYFSGGILPTYVLIKSLGLLNRMWSLILPVLVNPFFMIILKTSMGTIPESLTESARMDGASYLRVLGQIILPLSKPILATLALFYAVFRWNTFQDALFYISSSRLYTLQLKLTYIILMNTSTEVLLSEGAAAKDRIVPAAITAATVMVATAPILALYPWLQRYFISGVMIGSVKG